MCQDFGSQLVAARPPRPVMQPFICNDIMARPELIVHFQFTYYSVPNFFLNILLKNADYSSTKPPKFEDMKFIYTLNALMFASGNPTPGSRSLWIPGQTLFASTSSYSSFVQRLPCNVGGSLWLVPISAH